MFINRKQELSALETRYHSGRSEFVVAYGRRRVGKTVLLKQFAHDKEHVYFLADLRPEAEQLRYFTQQLYQVTQEPMLALEHFSSWDTALTYLGQICQNRRLIGVIDEYPYLCTVNPAFPSILQRLWDERLKNSQFFLVICGSSISMMEREVLGHSSPLYGRRTSQFLVEPMGFFDAIVFFPNRAIDRQIETYAISDGIPAYLEQFASDRDLWDEVSQVVLRKDGFLYDEVRFMLMEELREPLKRLNRSGELPFKAANFGAWWTRNEEIDLVALSDDGTRALVGECKWTKQPVGTNILDVLRSKASLLIAQTSVQHVDYALFARSGFTDALRRTAEIDRVLLYPLAFFT
ncbi:ATP-binding protein [Candidatus Poribacteria bacterium]|nr:ATP-binding protein [Candidatus Poribacteria bacterium]